MGRIAVLAIASFTIVLPISAAGADLNCRAEAAAIVAELRAGADVPYSEAAVTMAREAALAMCSRIARSQPVADTSSAAPVASSTSVSATATGQSTPSTPAPSVADTSNDTTTVNSDETTVFGIPVGSSERNAGHKRLIRRK